MPTDAQLLTIKTTEENDFVSKYMYDDPLITSRVWLGMDFNAQGNSITLNRSKTVKQCSNRIGFSRTVLEKEKISVKIPMNKFRSDKILSLAFTYEENKASSQHGSIETDHCCLCQLVLDDQGLLLIGGQPMGNFQG